MGFTRGRKRAGFTLIELLVVVAIIALLISILLPSLSEAREQAKVARCLSNLKNLMNGTWLYFGEYNDKYPIYSRRINNWLGIAGFLSFGKTSDIVWRDYVDGVFYVPLRERVLNKHIMGSDPHPDLVEGNTVIKRTEVEVVMCPSDRQSIFRPILTGSNEPEPISTYDDVGTSYLYNFTALAIEKNVDPWRHWQPIGEGWSVLGRMLVRDTFGGMASTFVFYQEPPFSTGISNRIPTIGNHGKPNMHSAAFLDGHAEYRLMDTRGYCGIGWAAINPNWVFKRGTGQRAPPVYYKHGYVNCDPPR